MNCSTFQVIEGRFCHHDPFEYEYEYRCTEYEYDCPDERHVDPPQDPELQAI
jgi:hypothetical protein